jgi:hypothetical protein
MSKYHTLEKIIPFGYDYADENTFTVAILFDVTKASLNPFLVEICEGKRRIRSVSCMTLRDAIEESGYQLSGLTDLAMQKKSA